MSAARRRTLIGAAAVLALLLPLGWFWYASLLPDTYPVTAMGAMDFGGGPSGHQHAAEVPVSALVADPQRRADVTYTLVARRQRVTPVGGRAIDGYTLNGTSPGPQLRATEGQLVEVTLVNESVPGGVTLHWHGVDVPNAADGVAGVTQDAVKPGGRYTYRFVADRAGTFWYHSHQLSHEQVLNGLFGALIIVPRATQPDQVALVHLYDGQRTVNGQVGTVVVPATVGATVRVRVINTDNGVMNTWVSGAPYRLVAVDGSDLHGPTDITDAAVAVTAGGRADLAVRIPAGGVRVALGGNTALVLAPAGATGPAGTAAPRQRVDLLHYGTPAPTGLDPAQANRRFRYDIGRRPGFLDGVPGLWWTVNGKLYPDVPMFVVTEGDLVQMTISNASGDAHPMHLHGHHALVVSRNGQPATGSPWWIDSLNVGDGETYTMVFRADNPGLWMDHCHNLPHAAEGLVAHLMYTGVSTPYRIGTGTANEPE